MSQIRVNEVVSENALSAPHFPFGATGIGSASDALYANVAGIATYAQGLTGTPDITVGNIVAVGGTFSGDLQVQGTVTYEDVSNVDSVGVITAQQGINVTSGGINVTGVVTATSFEGDGTNLVLDYQDLTIRTWIFGPAG